MTTAMVTNEKLTAALAYAKRLTWAVLPLHSVNDDGSCTCGKPDCSSIGKHPRTKNGLSDASTDPDRINQWWTQWPGANIGVRTGAESGIVAIDIDSHRGGDNSLEDLENEIDKLPDTVEQQTGSGGRHLIFKHPGQGVKCSQSELGSGIDVKGDGGYIVVPPSSNANGPYAWELSSRPLEVEIAALPQRLLQKLSGDNGHQEKKLALPILETIPEGKRNGELLSVAGSMRRRGCEASEILPSLIEMNKRCQPPLEDAEVEKIAASIARYEPAPQLSANGHPSVSVTATEVLDAAGLRDLAGKSIDEIVTVLRQVAEQLKTADGDALLRAAVRGESIARLKNAKVVSSPAHLVDSALKGLTTASEEDDRQGKAMVLTDPEPWPEPVDGRELLSELQEVVERYVVLPEGGATATALWSFNTYVHDASEISPYLGIVSPDKRCGKTTLLIVLGQQVLRPVPASNISSASLFRAVEEFRPTLIIDEAETFLKENEELRGILNAGHRQSNAYVIRTVGDDHEPRFFSTWCPKAFALIGRLPETLEDRSIVIPMRRRAPGEHVERLRVDQLDLGDLRRKIARWASDRFEELRNADPEMPDGLSDRAEDNWRPLLAIADLVGGEWPSRARKAAKVLSGRNPGSDDAGSARTMLLQDLQGLFKMAEWLASEGIVEALVQMEDRPWPEWKRGQPITQRGVAKLLEPFDVRPKQVWVDGKNRRGYEKAWFEDAWKRYLAPQTPETLATSDRSDRIVGGQQVTPDSQVIGDEVPIGCENPVSGCGTTILSDLTVRDPQNPQNHHVPADSKGEAEWEVVL